MASLAIGDAITTISLVLLSVVLARTLTSDDMAIWRQSLLIAQFAVTIAELGLGAATLRFAGAIDPERRQLLLRHIGIAAITAACLGTVCVLAAVLFLWFVDCNHVLAVNVALMIPSVVGSILFSVARANMLTNQKALQATLVDMLFAVGGSSALVLAAWAGARLEISIAAWSGVSFLRLIVFAVGFHQQKSTLRGGLDGSIMQELWHYCLPLQLSKVPAVGMGYLDKILSARILSNADFSAYSLNARELPLISGLPYSMGAALTPRLVQLIELGDMTTVRQIWHKACLSCALVAYPIAAFAIVNSKSIVRVLYTERYSSGWLPFACFASIAFVRVVDYGNLPRAFSKNKQTLRVALVAFSLSAPITIIMTTLYGVWGVSFSVLISTLIVAVGQMHVGAQLIRCSVWQLLPLRILLHYACAAFASVLAANKLVNTLLSGTRVVTGGADLTYLTASFAVSSSVYALCIVVMRKCKCAITGPA